MLQAPLSQELRESDRISLCLLFVSVSRSCLALGMATSPPSRLGNRHAHSSWPPPLLTCAECPRAGGRAGGRFPRAGRRAPQRAWRRRRAGHRDAAGGAIVLGEHGRRVSRRLGPERRGLASSSPHAHTHTHIHTRPALVGTCKVCGGHARARFREARATDMCARRSLHDAFCEFVDARCTALFFGASALCEGERDAVGAS